MREENLNQGRTKKRQGSCENHKSMKFEVNTNSSSFRALNNLNRVGNLLSIAVSGLSGGLRANHAGEDASGLGMAESFTKAPQGAKKRLPTNPNDTTIQISDKILASPSGWARMGALAGSLISSQAINPEIVGTAVNLARHDIVEDPEKALSAQANQRPDSILKLLE